MTTMTKKVVSRYGHMFFGPSPYNAARNQKLNDMVLSGKSDGYGESWYVHQCDGYTDRGVSFIAQRHFIDQAAAEEYRDVLVSLAAEHDIELIGITIEDI